jgi:hypothetical protein
MGHSVDARGWSSRDSLETFHGASEKDAMTHFSSIDPVHFLRE